MFKEFFNLLHKNHYYYKDEVIDCFEKLLEERTDKAIFEKELLLAMRGFEEELCQRHIKKEFGAFLEFLGEGYFNEFYTETKLKIIKSYFPDSYFQEGLIRMLERSLKLEEKYDRSYKAQLIKYFISYLHGDLYSGEEENLREYLFEEMLNFMAFSLERIDG